MSWRQKSKCLWLKEVDGNTKYFQRIANSFKRSNQIDTLKVGDEIMDDKYQNKNEILDFYQNLYTKKEQWRPTATFEDLASLTMEQRECLERAFEEDEILATINPCAPDKAPGPDGYTMAFY